MAFCISIFEVVFIMLKSMLESKLISQQTYVVQLPQPYAFKEADRVATYLLAK